MELLKKIKEYCELIVFLFSCGIFYKLKTWGFDNWEIILCVVPMGILLVSLYFFRKGYIQYSGTSIILVTSVFLGSVVGTSIGAWFWLHRVEPFPKDKVGVYIARFKGDFGTTYRDEILQALIAEIEKAGVSNEVLIRKLPKCIWGAKSFTQALDYCVKGNASVVMWGEFPSEKKVRAYLTFLGGIPQSLTPSAPIRITHGEGIGLQGNLTEIEVPEELIKKPLSLVNLILGWACYTKGEYAKAIEKLDSLIRENPDFSEAYYILGRIHLVQKDYKAAASDFEKAIATVTLSPKLPLSGYQYYCYIGLAASYFNLKQLDKCVEMYKKTTNLFPDIPTVHHLLGLAYSACGKHKMAIEELKEALDLYSRYKGVERHVAITSGAGIYISVYQENVMTLYWLGKEHIEIGQQEEALKYFKKITELEPNLEDIQSCMITILSDKRTIDETVKAWIELGFEPDYMFYHRLGICFLLSGHEGDAIKAFEKAIERKPSYLFSYFSLGEAYLRQGLLKEAIKTQLALQDLNKELGVELLLFYRRQVLSDEVFAEKLREQIQHLPLEYQNLANKLLKRKEAN